MIKVHRVLRTIHITCVCEEQEGPAIHGMLDLVHATVLDSFGLILVKDLPCWRIMEVFIQEGKI